MFDDEKPDWDPAPRPRPQTFLHRQRVANFALAGLIVAGVSAFVAVITWYLSQLEPCLYVDGGFIGNCGTPTGPMVVAGVVGVPSVVLLIWALVRDRSGIKP